MADDLCGSNSWPACARRPSAVRALTRVQGARYVSLRRQRCRLRGRAGGGRRARPSCPTREACETTYWPAGAPTCSTTAERTRSSPASSRHHVTTLNCATPPSRRSPRPTARCSSASSPAPSAEDSFPAPSTSRPWPRSSLPSRITAPPHSACSSSKPTSCASSTVSCCRRWPRRVAPTPRPPESAHPLALPRTRNASRPRANRLVRPCSVKTTDARPARDFKILERETDEHERLRMVSTRYNLKQPVPVQRKLDWREDLGEP